MGKGSGLALTNINANFPETREITPYRLVRDPAPAMPIDGKHGMICSVNSQREASRMQDFQSEFLKFAIESGVLCFGEFTLKSGRTSPYFFNSGLFDSGAKLARLGRFYAQAILASGVRFDQLFGPAYKGIPLVAATAIALAEQHGVDRPYAFNRKEAKDHGEGGTIVGAPLRGRVLIVDDVISAGTSVRESGTIIQAAGAQLAGVVVSLDRQERGDGECSAIQAVEQEMGVPVVSIANLDTLLAYVSSRPEMSEWREKIYTYRAHYGAG